MTTTPALRGTLLVIASSIAFGLTTPLVQRLVRAGHGVGPFMTATLLYAGSATIGLATRSDREAPLRREHAPRLLGVALAGALVAPALLAWGLAHTSGTSGALMLNLEGVFTVALAWMLHREHVGGRVSAAVLTLLAGGALLVLDRARDATPGSLDVLGLCAVAGAALAWGVDNVVGRPLSALDPSAVVGAKGALGAALSLGVVLTFERSELLGVGPGAAALLVLVGAVGYGVSLRLYLRAQRAIGAGRTASVFASGPFWGAALAWALGERMTPLVALGAVFMIAGLVLHLTERHGHEHVHEPVEHEHAHAHDDGHHDHTHDPMPVGEHTHPHRHDRLVHDHPHLPDLHHEHAHEAHEAGEKGTPAEPPEPVSRRSSDEADRR